MSNENNVIKALVKLAMCPGNRSECPYTAMCSHACHGDACAKALRDDYGYIFNDVHSIIAEPTELDIHTERVMHVNGAPAELDIHTERVMLAKKVTAILQDIGVPAHIKGYAYLRAAIIMAVDNPRVIEAITKELYPTLAKTFDTTPSRIERAVRHAIGAGWDRGDLDVLYKYFGNTVKFSRSKPTNSEFIALIADKIRLDM